MFHRHLIQKMKATKIDLKSGRLFPWYFQLVGIVLLPISVTFLASNFMISIILVIVAIFILTSFSGFEIDIQNKIYYPYYTFFFLFKSGKKKKFNEVEKLYINANKVSQRIYTAHTTQSATFKNVEYDAYIKFDNGAKEYLISDKKLDRLKTKLTTLSEAINISISDNT